MICLRKPCTCPTVTPACRSVIADDGGAAHAASMGYPDPRFPLTDTPAPDFALALAQAADALLETMAERPALEADAALFAARIQLETALMNWRTGGTGQ